MNTATNYADLYLADISTDKDLLENNVRDFPASAAARFLFLCRLKKNNDPRFNEIVKQTGIYLHNPYWMEIQLSHLSIANDDSLKVNLPAHFASEAITSNVDDEPNLPLTDSVVENLPVEQSPVVQNIQTEIKNEQENRDENNIEAIATEANFEELTQPVNEQLNENSILEPESPPDQNIQAEGNDEPQSTNENNKEAIVQEGNNEELPQPVNEQINENPVLDNEFPAEQNIEGDNKEEPGSTNQNNKIEIADEVPNEELPLPVNEQIKENPVLELKSSPEENTNVSVNENNNSTEQEEVKNGTKEENFSTDENSGSEYGDKESVPFEPLHTVDYFASQGIKLSEDALSNDQLGKQVKSFTAWLKSMKKLHPGQLPEQNEVIEKLIQTSSEASNQSANVLTEAMAEVLVKQGKQQKAIIMYQKLSLINPSKSAYFAAKIEILKSI